LKYRRQENWKKHSMLFVKVGRVEKFATDGNAFLTLLTRSAKNFFWG